MNKSITLLSISIVFFLQGFSQNSHKNKKDNFAIVFYNVENLFDTIDTPDKIDEQFLPESEKKWTGGRYNKKINDLGNALSSININELPELIGLCEVENKAVLKDLINGRFLSKAEYAIVHEESPDVRGIDVALLYRKDEFKYLNHKIFRISYDFEPETTTRDILYVKGELKNGEKLHVFVNHWSSRRGGQKKSEPKRIHSAKVLRSKIDSVQKENNNSKIAVIGDFNDEPENKSLFKVLNAKNNFRSNNHKELYNLMYDKSLYGQGSYNYKGNWSMLDNIIISQSLVKNKNGYIVSTDGAQVFKKRWMLYDNVKTGQMTPSRTYGGPNYYGGVSDHFPVYVILRK